MSNKIILKKSSVAAKVPQTTDLEYGEVALNYSDGRMYFKTATNQIDFFSAGAASGGGAFPTVDAGSISDPINTSASVDAGTIS